MRSPDLTREQEFGENMQVQFSPLGWDHLPSLEQICDGLFDMVFQNGFGGQAHNIEWQQYA